MLIRQTFKVCKNYETNNIMQVWNYTPAQNEALFNQGSRSDSLQSGGGNLYEILLLREEFHQRNHLALYLASTAAGTIFWSLSRVISDFGHSLK